MRDNYNEDHIPEILIVDDMPDNVRMTSLVFKEKGYKVRIALSGKLALQAVQDNLPDLILLDIDMPEMDGFEVCEQLKTDDNLKKIPVIFISSMCETIDKVKAFKVGGVDYVEKPFLGAELFARIETQLKIRNLQHEVSCHNQRLETLVHERTAQLASTCHELEQSHFKLQESEKRYRRITEEITDYVYTVTVRDGRALETRHGMACEAITGYKAQEFAEAPLLWINMVPPEERDEIVEHVKKILAGKELPAIEHRIVRKDGQIRWVIDKAVLHFDFNDVLVSYEGVISDITERKQAEDKLIRTKEELELAHNKLIEASQSERLALTGRIAANIAHEIRNPSTSASLALAQLRCTLKPKEKQVICLEIIERNINRINYLVDEMLNCARPLELNLKPHDIHEILGLAIQSAEMKMKVKKIRLMKKFTAVEPTVKVDKEQIGRVFLNIIINAIDAMSKKGDILTIVTENNGEVFLIKIKDTGKGIPEGDIIKIFDPFFTSKPSGIGLGLATCYSVVVRHGGTIEVSSEVSKGTIFTVTLPV